MVNKYEYDDELSDPTGVLVFFVLALIRSIPPKDVLKPISISDAPDLMDLMGFVSKTLNYIEKNAKKYILYLHCHRTI